MVEDSERSTIVPIRCPACGVMQKVPVTGESKDNGIKYSGTARAHCRACQQSMSVSVNWTATPERDH